MQLRIILVRLRRESAIIKNTPPWNYKNKSLVVLFTYCTLSVCGRPKGRHLHPSNASLEVWLDSMFYVSRDVTYERLWPGSGFDFAHFGRVVLM